MCPFPYIFPAKLDDGWNSEDVEGNISALFFTQYNDLRKDAVNEDTGHLHDGGVSGKTLDTAAFASGRFSLSRMPAGASGLFLKGNGVGSDPSYGSL